MPPRWRERGTPTAIRVVSHNVKAVYQRYMGWFDGNRQGGASPEAIGPRYADAWVASTDWWSWRGKRR